MKTLSDNPTVRKAAERLADLERQLAKHEGDLATAEGDDYDALAADMVAGGGVATVEKAVAGKAAAAAKARPLIEVTRRAVDQQQEVLTKVREQAAIELGAELQAEHRVKIRELTQAVRNVFNANVALLAFQGGARAACEGHSNGLHDIGLPPDFNQSLHKAFHGWLGAAEAIAEAK